MNEITINELCHQCMHQNEFTTTTDDLIANKGFFKCEECGTVTLACGVCTMINCSDSVKNCFEYTSEVLP